jgi:hypothetical protein
MSLFSRQYKNFYKPLHRVKQCLIFDTHKIVNNNDTNKSGKKVTGIFISFHSRLDTLTSTYNLKPAEFKDSKILTSNITLFKSSIAM